ncbi:MAG: hypothetical protein NZ518_02740 [Dehalococcoidia bacterium]|nr:hypothetical protein [Dehalococcoidia bacterium]
MPAILTIEDRAVRRRLAKIHERSTGLAIHDGPLALPTADRDGRT